MPPAAREGAGSAPWHGPLWTSSAPLAVQLWVVQKLAASGGSALRWTASYHSDFPATASRHTPSWAYSEHVAHVVE